MTTRRQAGRWRRWRPVATFALVAVLVLAAAAALVARDGVPPAVGDRVQLDLWASIDDLEGVDWPTGPEGSPREGATIDEPHTVELAVGEGDPFVTPSQLTFLDQREGELVLVEVQPPAEPRGLTATIDDLEGLLERNGLLNGEVDNALEEWRQGGEPAAGWPGTPTLSFRAHLTRAEMFVQARAVQDGGWFYTISFSRPVEQWPSVRELDPDRTGGG